jgi:serine/threonine protein kinase/tetratricopeptide (TPR) repeat protein
MGEPIGIDSLKTLGKYTLIEKLSDGYLGPVYRGFDQELDRAVEVRILCNGIKWDADILDLFRKECASVASLQHPNIASIIEANTEGKFPYIAMESLGNRNLKKLIEQKSPISFEAKIAMMVQIAEGLDYAHKNGILHHNLCPENIYLSPDDGIKIRDFALTHVLMGHLTRPGVRWGAPIYLSPEQIQHKQCDARSDIFALGIIFYEFLTGVHPFYDPDGNKTLDNILQDIQIPTFEQYPEFHPRIWRILKTCLAKNPDDRYGNVNKLLEAYRSLLKDMAEDVRLMLSELQASFTSLRIAAEQPDASESVITLFDKVRHALHHVENTDYVKLDLLTTDLMKVYPEIRDSSGEQKMLDSILNPRSRPDELPFTDKRNDISGQEKPPRIEEETYEVSTSENPAASDSIMEEAGLPEESVDEAPSSDAGDAALAAGVEDNCPCQKNGTESTPKDPVHLSNEENNEEADTECAEEKPIGSSVTVPQKSSEISRKSSLTRVAFRQKKYRFSRPTFRMAAVLLSILLIVAAVHILQEKNMGETLHGAWQNFILDPLTTLKTSSLNDSSSGNSGEVLPTIAEITENGANLQYEDALLEEMEESYSRDSATSPPQTQLDRIGAIIDGGNLDQAEEELYRLRRLYPNSTAVTSLGRRLQAKISGIASGQQSGQVPRRSTGRNKEDAWESQFANFFSQGEYKEANQVVGLWLGELPKSSRAQKSAATIKEIQTRIAACTSAMEEKRYRAALSELGIAERINPADPQFAVLRQEIESRMSSAMGTLSVYPLGAKASILLDGKRIDSDGEIRGISIPVGSHTIAVENDGYLVASRNQQLLDGQEMAFVYDLSARDIRPMIESDRELLSQRQAMEESYSFTLEHVHGIFRGTCRGELKISYHEIVYQPTSGSHGFRVPFKLFKLKSDGRSIDLYFISDNEHFHQFMFEDEQTARHFTQIWEKLKSLPQ